MGSMIVIAAEACMAVANTAAVMNVFVFMGLLWVVFVVFVVGFFFEMFSTRKEIITQYRH
jgi:hypothetical protein